MAHRLSDPEWRQSWPQVIARTRTDTAVEYLQRYYAVLPGGKSCYTGSRFEAMAPLKGDPNALGPEDFVAVSMLSVDVLAEAAIRLLRPDAGRVADLLS
jgi:hypothetical protein